MSNEKDKAARTIQSFWRINNSKKEGINNDYIKVKRGGGFYHQYLKIKSLTAENLCNKEIDSLIKEAINYCITRESKHGLRMIAYALFSNKKSHLNVNGETCPIIYLLYCAFSDVKASAKDIAFVLLDLFISGKEVLSKPSCDFVQEKLPTGEHWGDWEDKSGVKYATSDEVINISHGGGLFYIIDFLTGRKQGYRLESYGLGLQVSPARDKKNDNYQRAGSYAILSYTRGFFDLPAKLEAQIPCGKLLRAHLHYEAGLRPEHKTELKNVIIEEVVIKPTSIASGWPGVNCFNPTFIKNRYGKKYPEQTKRLINIITRLANDERLEISQEEYKGHSPSDQPRFQLKI